MYNESCSNQGLFFTPFLTNRLAAWAPALDVSEDKDQYTIKVDLPGIKKEDVKVSFEDSVLTIEGERKEEAEQKDTNYHRVEREYGSFIRALKLGTTADASGITANYKDGVLDITVRKLAKAKATSVDINIS